jgi:carboxylesterase
MDNLQEIITEKGFYYKGTNNKAVLLVHGLTGVPLEMKFIGKALHKEGFTVVCPLLEGHAKGTKELLKTNWRDWYATIEKTFLALRERFKKVYVAGICVGGMIGLNLAAEYGEMVEGAAIYSAAIRYDGWNIPVHGFLSFLIPLIGNLPPLRYMGFDERPPYGIKDDRLRKIILRSDILKETHHNFPYPMLKEMYALNSEMEKKYQKIKAPTLLLHAKNDDLSHYRNSEYIYKKITAPKEMHLLEDSYHMIHIDKERDKVAKMTTDFFNKH